MLIRETAAKEHSKMVVILINDMEAPVYPLDQGTSASLTGQSAAIQTCHQIGPIGSLPHNSKYQNMVRGQS